MGKAGEKGKGKARVDWRLVTGAVLFGVGWGMEGVCRECILLLPLYHFQISMLMYPPWDLGWV